MQSTSCSGHFADAYQGLQVTSMSWFCQPPTIRRSIQCKPPANKCLRPSAVRERDPLCRSSLSFNHRNPTPSCCPLQRRRALLAARRRVGAPPPPPCGASAWLLLASADRAAVPPGALRPRRSSRSVGGSARTATSRAAPPTMLRRCLCPDLNRQWHRQDHDRGRMS